MAVSATVTSSPRAARADAAWPPISICVPGGTGTSRSALRTAASAPPRSPVLVAAVISTAGRRPSRRSTAGASGRSNADDLAERQRARPVGDRRARERLGVVANRHRDSAGARRSCAPAGGSARPRGPSSAIVRSSPTVGGVEAEPRELIVLELARVEDRRHALAAVEEVVRARAASRASRRRPRRTCRAPADRRRAP